MEKTIVALSTARGRSAIAVVRMSGEKSIEIAKKIFSPFPEKPNYLKVGTLKTKDFNEQAMCVYFVAPRSYTGENSVEFHCHGGSAVPKAVIEACLDNGAVMAQNGEFSKRAFINGKQNLTNAEGIIEMIDAETASAAKAGANLMENKLGKQITELQNRLLDLLSSTEAALDYPEEDLELPTLAQVKSQISDILSVLESLIATSTLGKVAKWGIDVAIVGAPNVGKSSLLNALLGENRAIVSEIQGTTRDTLCESILHKDIKINFIDTAGIRETTDKIEEEGIRRAEAAAEKADVVLYLVDSPTDKSTYKTGKPLIKVYNKADLYTAPQTKDGEIAISAKYGDTEVIKELLYKMFNADEIQTSDLLITNERHLSCLKQAYELLKSTTKAENATLDIVSTAMRQTWEKLGEITGSTASEDIINNIYSKFCLGK